MFGIIYWCLLTGSLRNTSRALYNRDFNLSFPSLVLRISTIYPLIIKFISTFIYVIIDICIWFRQLPLEIIQGILYNNCLLYFTIYPRLYNFFYPLKSRFALGWQPLLYKIKDNRIPRKIVRSTEEDSCIAPLQWLYQSAWGRRLLCPWWRHSGQCRSCRWLV